MSAVIKKALVYLCAIMMFVSFLFIDNPITNRLEYVNYICITMLVFFVFRDIFKQVLGNKDEK